MRLFHALSLKKTKCQAYLIYSEWGPPRGIPRDQRLAECFPKVPAETRAAWMKEFDQVEAAIWEAARTGGPRTGSFATFVRQMRASFLFMNDEALSRAWTLTLTKNAPSPPPRKSSTNCATTG